MIRYQNHALGKVAFESPVRCLPHLSSHTFVTADPDLGGCPPVRHGGCDDAKVLLGHGHPGVEEVFAVEVQGQANVLGNGDTETGC